MNYVQRMVGNLLQSTPLNRHPLRAKDISFIIKKNLFSSILTCASQLILLLYTNTKDQPQRIKSSLQPPRLLRGRMSKID
ncbi:MAG: hypothetical protein R6U21_02330 [Thermoplasmatota archaeon]